MDEEELPIYKSDSKWNHFFTNSELSVGDKFIYETKEVNTNNKSVFKCEVISSKYENCDYCPFVKVDCSGIGCNCIILKRIK